MNKKHETLSLRLDVMAKLRERVAKSHRTLSGEVLFLMEEAEKQENKP